MKGLECNDIYRPIHHRASLLTPNPPKKTWGAEAGLSHSQEHAADIDRPLLIIYFCYRLGITALLWSLFFTDTGIGINLPALFISSALIYLAVNTLTLALLLRGWQPNFNALLFIVGSDILLIQLIAQASGLVESGLGTLMVISVAAGSIFTRGKTVWLVPTFATLSLLGGVFFRVLSETASKAEVAASGWLGFSFFVTSLAISYLTGRMQKSEHRARQAALNAEKLQHLNQLIIARMQTGILLAEPNGHVLSYNQSAEKLFGQTIHNKDFNLGDIHPSLARFHNQVQDYFATGDPIAKLSSDNFAKVHSVEGNNYKLTWINLEKNMAADCLIFVEDLSKIAQQAQQMKLSSLGKITASIAHEIRNPLGAASHAAQLLQEGIDSEEDSRLTQIIVEQTKRCSNIIETVMDVSRGKAARDQLFDLALWIPEFLKRYKLDKKTEIQYQCPASVAIRFDPSHLEQILSNLLDNAIRHSVDANGRAKAYLKVAFDEDDCPRVDILDQGQGVKLENRNRLFEPFFTTGKLGSGLGLYMCRELCEANQATISYLDSDQQKKHSINGFSAHYFRVQFSHPDRQALGLVDTTK